MLKRRRRLFGIQVRVVSKSSSIEIDNGCHDLGRIWQLDSEIEQQYSIRFDITPINNISSAIHSSVNNNQLAVQIFREDFKIRAFHLDSCDRSDQL